MDRRGTFWFLFEVNRTIFGDGREYPLSLGPSLVGIPVPPQNGPIYFKKDQNVSRQSIYWSIIFSRLKGQGRKNAKMPKSFLAVGLTPHKRSETPKCSNFMDVPPRMQIFLWHFRLTLLRYVRLITAWAIRLSSVTLLHLYAHTWTFRKHFCTV